MIYEFENKWQKDYYFLILILITFLAPILFLSGYNESATVIKHVRNSVFVLFGIISVLMFFFTKIKGQEATIDRLKHDKIFLKDVLFRAAGIAGILIIYFIYS